MLRILRSNAIQLSGINIQEAQLIARPAAQAKARFGIGSCEIELVIQHNRRKFFLIGIHFQQHYREIGSVFPVFLQRLVQQIKLLNFRIAGLKLLVSTQLLFGFGVFLVFHQHTGVVDEVLRNPVRTFAHFRHGCFCFYIITGHIVAFRKLAVDIRILLFDGLEAFDRSSISVFVELFGTVFFESRGLRQHSNGQAAGQKQFQCFHS